MLPINKKISLVNFTDRNTTPKYIVIHYVGAVSTAKNNADYFYSKYRGASAHYFVDENSIWQVVNDNDSAWHCGTKGKYYHKYCRNSNSIGIEMCVKKNKDGKWYFEDATVKNTIELTKSLMKKYNIPVENVIRHYDVTHKVCPEPYVRNVSLWNGFKANLVEQPKPLPKVEAYSGRVTSKINGLAYHSKPDWSSSTVLGRINKGQYFDIVGRVKVEGVYMYKTKEGYYITSATVYVTYSKPAAPKPSIYYKKYTGKSGSIVVALNAIGVKSSFSYRLKIAKANGIKYYVGTAKQNTDMLNKLKQGKLKKA